MFLHGEDGRAGLERMNPPRAFHNWSWGESGLSHGTRVPTFKPYLNLHECKAVGLQSDPAGLGLITDKKMNDCPTTSPGS